MKFNNQFTVESGPNTAFVLRLTSTGAGGGTTDHYVSNATPEGAIVANEGDLCSVVGALGRIFLKRTGNATNTGWIELTPGGTAKFAQTIGDGANQSFTLNHNLNTTDIVVYVKDVATNQQVGVNNRSSGANQAVIDFDFIPANLSHRVIIIG